MRRCIYQLFRTSLLSSHDLEGTFLYADTPAFLQLSPAPSPARPRPHRLQCLRSAFHNPSTLILQIRDEPRSRNRGVGIMLFSHFLRLRTIALLLAGTSLVAPPALAVTCNVVKHPVPSEAQKALFAADY